MDDVQDRLTESSKECLEAYSAWENDKKNDEKRERFMASIHELRKVTSRLEIELAISERNEQAKKPIPIPPHRSKNKKGGDDDLPDFIKNNGKDDNGGPKGGKKPSRSKSSNTGGSRRKKSDNNDG